MNGRRHALLLLNFLYVYVYINIFSLERLCACGAANTIFQHHREYLYLLCMELAVLANASALKTPRLKTSICLYTAKHCFFFSLSFSFSLLWFLCAYFAFAAVQFFSSVPLCFRAFTKLSPSSRLSSSNHMPRCTMTRITSHTLKY